MDNDTTVFVVDDDAGARESVVALVGLRGLKAEGFSSAEEFLAQYNPARKGCVVIDVRMAGMSGLDLLKKLKDRNNFLPVVVITGYADVPMAVRAMQEGAVCEHPLGAGGRDIPFADRSARFSDDGADATAERRVAPRRDATAWASHLVSDRR